MCTTLFAASTTIHSLSTVGREVAMVRHESP
jgi:hypothetical protein